MFGAIINAAGILLGSLIGWLWRKNFKPQTESFLKLGLGAFTVYYGLRLAWMGFSGTFGQVLKQFAIALLAVMVGRLLGKLMHLQKASNAAGQYALKLIENTKPN